MMEMELVLLAKMQESLVILSNSKNNLRLMPSDSTMASITMSEDRRSSKFKENLRRLRASETFSCK